MIYPDDQCETVGMGGSFGVSPTMKKELMVGVMKTKVDDCQVRMWLFFRTYFDQWFLRNIFSSFCHLDRSF